MTNKPLAYNDTPAAAFCGGCLIGGVASRSEPVPVPKLDFVCLSRPQEGVLSNTEDVVHSNIDQSSEETSESSGETGESSEEEVLSIVEDLVFNNTESF